MTSYRLRPMNETDLPFLRKVYASTRQMEMDLTDWSNEQKAQFLSMQFDAQLAHYQRYYHDAEFNVVEVAGEDAGRLYRLDRENDTRIVDIALMPAYRNKGIGSEILNHIIAEARKRGGSVSIHVEKANPALSLYQRLGFEAVHDEGVYLLMKVQTAASGAPSLQMKNRPIPAINN